MFWRRRISVYHSNLLFHNHPSDSSVRYLFFHNFLIPVLSFLNVAYPFTFISLGLVPVYLCEFKLTNQYHAIPIGGPNLFALTYQDSITHNKPVDSCRVMCSLSMVLFCLVYPQNCSTMQFRASVRNTTRSRFQTHIAHDMHIHLNRR